MVKPRIPEGEAIEDNEQHTMEEYSEQSKKRARQYRGVVKYLLNEVGISPNAQVLQIGPGPDWIGVFLLKERTDISLTGIEPSSDMIRVAKANGRDENVEIKYESGVVEDLGIFEDNSFDVIFSNESLHHWLDPVKAFCEIKRVLRKNGRLCILDDHRDLGVSEKIIVEVVGRIVAGKWQKWWKSSIDASYTKNEIEHMLATAGITDWNVSTGFLELKIER